MMRCAHTDRPLCEECSDPIDPPELVDVDGEPFHEDCALWHELAEVSR